MRDRALSAEEQVLALATKRAVEAAGGLERCAAETGKSTSQLSRCGSTELPDSMALRDAFTIDALGRGTRGAPFALNALARLHGMILIDGPGAVTDGDCLQASVMELTCELGEVASTIRAATADGEWSANEVRATLREFDELDAVSARARAKLMAMLRPDNGEEIA